MRFPRAFLVYLLFASLSFLILLTNIKIPSSRYLAWRNLILNLYAPALWGIESYALDNLNLPREVLELLSARRRNEELNNLILRYELKTAEYDVLRAENEFLRRALSLPPRPGYSFVAAELVSRDPAAWALSCMVNKGSAGGVRKNSAAVLVKNGRFVLAGKVSEVFEGVSEVMLLTNPMFAVPAVVVGGGADGILEHFDSRAMVLNYPSLLSAPVGAEVTVGSMSRIFPPGILIGRVKDNRGAITIIPEMAGMDLSRMIIIVER